VSASSAINNGTLDLAGSDDSATRRFWRNCDSRGGFAEFHRGRAGRDVNLSGDALLQFGSGQIASIEYARFC